MNVGFTGTRKGMSPLQMILCAKVLAWLEIVTDAIAPITDPPTFHHGAAVGADLEAERLATIDGYTTIPYPAGRDPLARNQEIVAAVDILIAAPEKDLEELRSGTWATVRYARKRGIPIILLPRGK